MKKANIAAIKRMFKAGMITEAEYHKFLKRDMWEIMIDKHNHKLELIRTIGSVIGAIGGMLATLKVLHVI